MAWSALQARSIANSLKKQIGNAKPFITPTVREALIRATVLGIVLGQDAETVRVKDVDNLLDMVQREMNGPGM